MDLFSLGVIVGICVAPFLTLVDIAGKIIVNAIKETRKNV